MSEEAAGRLRGLLDGPVDWNYLCGLAKRHSLLPLLYLQLNAIAPASVPPARLRELRERFFHNAAHNLMLAGELAKAVRILDEGGIPAMGYKGPALAVSAYGNLSLRRFSDLDVLVPKQDVTRAKQLLAAAGYRPHPCLAAPQESVLLRRQYSLALAKAGGGLLLELHWQAAADRFASPAYVDALWAETETVNVNGSEIRSPAAEVLLPALCVHGTKHLWRRLAWVCDVAELVGSHPGLDWDDVLLKAEGSGYQRMLFLGLFLAEGLLGAELPAEVRRRVRSEPSVAALAADVVSYLFAASEYLPIGISRKIRFNLRARARWRDRGTYFGFLFTPTAGDLAYVRLPPGLSFAYSLIRPFRLLLEGGEDH